MSKYNNFRDDDDDLDDELDEDLDDEYEDEDDDSSSSNPYGSGKPRAPLSGGLSGGGGSSGLRPSGLVGGPGSGGPGAGGSGLGGGGLGGNRPNLPGSPGSSASGGGGLGGNRPNLPGSPGSGSSGGGLGGGGLGGNRPNLPGSPGSGSSGGGLGGGGLGGNRPNLPGSPGSGSSGGGLGGNRPNLPGSPGGISAKPPSQPLPNVRPGDSGRSEDKPKSPFGGLGLGGKKDDGDKDKGKGLGARLPFGGGDKKDAPRGGDKPGGGNPLGGFASKLPFGGGDKKDAPRSGDKPSGSGPLGGLGARLPFGGGKKDDAPPPSRPGGGAPGGFGGSSSSGQSPFGANRPAMGGGAAPAAGGAKAAKPARARRFEMPFGLGGLFGGKKDAKAPKTRVSKGVKVEQGGLSLDTKLDIIGLALLVVSAALLLSSLSPNQGAITGEINRFLSYLFGWGAIAIPISALGAGIWLLIRHFGEDAPTLETQRIIGLGILYVTIITIMQFVKALEYPGDALQSGLLPQFLELSSQLGQGGGYIGGQLYTLLLTNAGEVAGFALLLIPLVVGLMLSLNLGIAELAMLIISNIRNMRDGARQAAIRREAIRAQRAEQRALAAPAAPQIAMSKPPAEALPAPARPALPTPAEPAIPMQLPLGAGQEPRSIPITQGGRTITASFDAEEGVVPAALPVRPPAGGAPITTPPPTQKPEQGGRGLGLGNLGKLAPAALVGGAAAAVKALTPTEETDEPEKPDEGRRGGFRLPTMPGRKPDGESSAPAQPAANKPGGFLGLGNRGSGPGSEAVKPPAPLPAQSAPPAAMAPRPPIQTPAAPPVSTGGQAPAQPPASTAPAPPKTADATGSEPPPRLGDLLRSPSSPGGSPPSARPDAGDTGRPAASGTPLGERSSLRPAPFTPAQPLRPTPSPFSKPEVPAASAPKPLQPDLEDDEDEEEDDLTALKPAQPKGIGIAPRPATDTPFGPPRVMGARPDGTNTPDKSADKSAEVGKPAASLAPGASWQDRMSALRGALPGDKDRPAEADSSSTRQELRSPTPPPIGSDVRQPPRIVKMDEDNEDINDDLDYLDDDIPLDDIKPAAMKPVSSTPAPSIASPPGQKPSPFAPRQPLTASSAFQRPDTPPTIVRPASPISPPAAPTPSTAPAANLGGIPLRPAAPTPTTAPTAPPLRTPSAAESEPPPPPRGSGRKEWRMPELGGVLASGMDQELDHALLLQRAKTIEETLNSFGAPGRVVEVRTGPVITQFGVEPDYLTVRGGKKVRVKVSTIAQLDKDLQLALGAKSIRIEAPVPGKGYVGIEVPNEQASIVRLRDVMESEQFKKIKSPLAIALGQGVDGTPISADLTGMPHLLIAGTTGSGKSVCVNSIIASLLLSNTPERLKFIMVDPKRVELTAYNGIPHLVAPVVVELERIVGVLKWVTREMDERYRRFSAAGARNIEDFNKHLPTHETLMPYIIVIIDELADLMMLAPEETERVITRLAALARATGIHLVIATQRPSVDVVTGLIKANFPARIAFAVAGSVDSRVILDQPGAERLLGRGDMLYMSGDSPAPQRLQGVFVSDTEINNITRYWRQQMDDPERAMAGKLTLSQFALDEMVKEAGSPNSGRASGGGGFSGGQQVRQQALWDRESGPSSFVSTREPDDDDGIGEDGEDEMYDEAVKLVRTLKKASVSLLQRRLRIGYTRAARLIDIMEERGVVGPAQSGSTPREVIG